MASSGMMKFTVVLTCLAVIASHADAAVSCPGVLNTVAPCVTYLRGLLGPVPAACCAGVKSLAMQAHTTPDRQAACRCLKPLLNSVPNGNAIPGIAPKCGVNLPFKITPSINCATIH